MHDRTPCRSEPPLANVPSPLANKPYAWVKTSTVTMRWPSLRFLIATRIQIPMHNKGMTVTTRGDPPCEF